MMRNPRNWTTGLMVVLLTAGLWLASATMGSNPAYAQDTTAAAPTGTPAKGELTTTDGQGNQVKCRNYPEAAGGTLLGVMVPCITRTMENSAISFSGQLITALNPLLYSFITLVVVFFGVKVLQGNARRLKTEVFVLILKIAFVIGLLQMVPTFLVPSAYNAMAESQAIVASAINNGTGLNCPVTKYGDANTPLIWMQMDCVLGKLYGITTGTGPNGTKQANMLLMSSAFGMLGGFLFGGTFGVTLFCACIGVLWTLFSMVLKTVVTFLSGYMYVCVMLILSPIFMPLILLKATEQYFNKWWQGILGAMLLPIIISSYVMFALMLYDKILFEPDSMFQQIFDPLKAVTVEKAPEKACDVHQQGDPAERSKETGIAEKALDGIPLVGNIIAPYLSGGNDPCGMIPVPHLDMAALGDGNTQKNKFNKMFHDAIKVLVTAMLINEGFKSVTTLLQNLLGSNAAASLARPSQAEQKFEKAVAGAKQGLKDTFAKDKDGKEVIGGVSGKEFLERVPRDMPGNVVRGFMNNLQ